ncbi:uncharacterized protein LOC112638471 [Camponotus floridanus]|uniref:uncharacterized protein LOC112638471 n=1 Tax=Camponotus floridanus TaxID=104421 RepID=UPI000DC666EC|nr:uncharacterized protein LOC112638471 [Camponotus floridanus]
MDNEAVDREIKRMRAQQAELNVAAAYEDAGQPAEGTSNTLLIELVHSIREIQTEMQYMREQMRNMQTAQANLNEEERTLVKICEEYNDIFHLEGKPLTCTATVEHEISTRADTAPVNVKPYRLPEKHKAEVNRQVQEMLQDEIIKTSTSRARLAMSAHDSPSSAKNNESVTKNDVISSSISETEHIIPTIIKESNQSGDISNFPIMFNQSKKFKTNSNSPTNIGVKFDSQDNILDDINDLNLEHNWRNKNTTQTNKRKTYLDNCPDWDISHTGKTRMGVANLQNVRELPFAAQYSTNGAQCSTIKKNSKFEKCGANFTHIDTSGKPKLRVVIDFRKLNELTIGDSFPLPNITDILDQLGNAKYFSTLNLASGYHQIPMAEKDKSKTTFSTPYGHYEFNRMLFGLKNAPATFQRLMNSVLMGLQGLRCLVYLDDIVIYESSLDDHNKRLKEVLQRLRKFNLKLQPDKCEFFRKEAGRANANADALSRNAIPGPLLEKDEKILKIEEEEETDADNITTYTEEEKKQILSEYHDAPIGGHQGIE